MSIIGKRLASASRRYRDVPVVLNGELYAERARLVDAIEEAKAKPSRLAGPAMKVAGEALERWQREHADDVLIVRVKACVGSEWKNIRIENPMPADKAKRDPEMMHFGYDIGGAVQTAVERLATVIEDGTEERPEPEEWAELWANLGEGDRQAIVQVVLNINAESTGSAFGDLGKASTASQTSETKSD